MPGLTRGRRKDFTFQRRITRSLRRQSLCTRSATSTPFVSGCAGHRLISPWPPVLSRAAPARVPGYAPDQTTELADFLALPVDEASPLPETGLAAELDEDLDRLVQARQLREQARLRRELFTGQTDAECDLCGREFPIELLVATHIKQRSSAAALSGRTSPMWLWPHAGLAATSYSSADIFASTAMERLFQAPLFSCQCISSLTYLSILPARSSGRL